ncbi:hypothetical protein SK128_001533 [Halocaridina rubra]|uniref:Uncharacterized protein n=1 Tax=Halocaridina rubra TaxID=373956 RepID=A0AAN8WAI6_HALRR
MKLLILVLSVVAVTWSRPDSFERYGGNDSSEETPGNLDDTFQFAYAVASPEHGTFHGHQSTRDDDGHTTGSYYTLGADGQWRQTIYADKGLGYQAVTNQRPAGSPPPQASAVSYQIFVHPGATAVSASGSGPIDTSRLIGRPVTSVARPSSASNFNVDIRSQEGEEGGEESAAETESEGSSGASGPVLSANLASAGPSTSPVRVIVQQPPAQRPITLRAPPPRPVNVAVQAASPPAINVQSAPPTPVNVRLQSALVPAINVQPALPTPVNVRLQAAPAPANNVQLVPPTPVNVRLQAAPAPAINVQPAPPTPVNVRLLAAPPPAINVQTARPTPVNFRLQAAPAPASNVQAARPSHVSVGLQAAPAPAINVQAARPSPENVRVQAVPSPTVKLQAAPPSPINVAIRNQNAKPINIQEPTSRPVNVAAQTLAQGPVTLHQSAPTFNAQVIRTQGQQQAGRSGGGNVRIFSLNLLGLNSLPVGSSVIPATTVPATRGRSRGVNKSGIAFARAVPFGDKI